MYPAGTSSVLPISLSALTEQLFGRRLWDELYYISRATLEVFVFGLVARCTHYNDFICLPYEIFSKEEVKKLLAFLSIDLSVSIAPPEAWPGQLRGFFMSRQNPAAETNYSLWKFLWAHTSRAIERVTEKCKPNCGFATVTFEWYWDQANVH